MCLIIAPGKDGKPALLPRDVFDFAYQRNNDGFGAMWIEDGRVQHFKTVGLTADEIYSQMEERVARNPETIFHMRLKTHGKIIPGLAHPFRVLNKGRHGKDLFFMHNGIFSDYGNKLSYGQSDTTVFKDKILIPLLTRDPDALEDPEVWSSIEKLTNGSRMVFLDGEGKTYFTHPTSWNEEYGLNLSNRYMLPTKSYSAGFHTPTGTSSRILTGDKVQVTGHFIYFRQIDRAGVISGHWCACPKIGYIRTESGNLYKDNGTNNKIYHAANYISRDLEFKHLGLTIVPTTEDIRDFGSAVMANDLDDDIPFEMSAAVDRSEATGPAPTDQRLRYARIVHNLYGGKVTSRTHLIGDLIGMGDKELASFVDEDSENTNVIVAELIEMVLEYNQALWDTNPNHEKIMDADEILAVGQTEYHRDAMKEIMKIRRKEYEEQLKRMNKIIDGEEKEKVNVA